jgi:Protein of unknown function (DUF3768)
MPTHFAYATAGRLVVISHPRESHMAKQSPNSVTRIQELNDAFRRSFFDGMVVVSAGFESLPADRRRLILARIRAFDHFDEDNDPHGEHDFGLIEDDYVRGLWKIDYYDTDMELMSPDPADSSVTTRVLTVMLAEEY